MRTDAIQLEDGRLAGLNLENYPWYYERHRIFPEVLFEKSSHRILDIAAGVGIVAKQIQDSLDCFMLCNDIATESLKNLKRNGLRTVSFDLDNPEAKFPFVDNSFDTVISLATIEHIINIKYHIREIRRILKPNGTLYLSAPNYSGIHFLIPFLINGKTFHDPMEKGLPEYEFHAHVRYFTYKSLLSYTESFGFKANIVYLPLPECSSRFKKLKEKSKVKAYGFRMAMKVFYSIMPPRWAFHPVICFNKTNGANEYCKRNKPKKIIL